MQFNVDSENKENLPDQYNCTVCIIGLGYVGLPLALEIFLKNIDNTLKKSFKRKVIGFDINKKRITDLKNNIDRTNEIKKEILKKCSKITFTHDEKKLQKGDVFIVTTPTPIDESKKPDLNLLKLACQTIGHALKVRNENQKINKNFNIPCVIFESTVFPGATEEICVPILEKESGLVFNDISKNNSFVCGYSPERINPGDNNRKLGDIQKVTSGSTPKVAKWIDTFYASFINAGTYLAPSIKVAEAAKVIENTQRDLNIALVNELSIILKKLDIDTLEVLKAAETKWNFIPFKPGLVGGHCIGVDPYYLTYKAEQIGYHPEVVLAGRRINDHMPQWIAEQLVLNLVKNEIKVKGSRLLILGLTFKENCPDFRNSKVFNLIEYLNNYGFNIEVVDPFINEEIKLKINSFTLKDSLKECSNYDSIILAVKHKLFTELSLEQWNTLRSPKGIIFDIKGIVPKNLNPIRI